MLEFLRALRSNAVVTRVAAVAAIGGFLFGYDTGIISGAILYIKRDFHAGSVEQEAVVSVLLIGAAAGALLSGLLLRRWRPIFRRSRDRPQHGEHHGRVGRSPRGAEHQRQLPPEAERQMHDDGDGPHGDHRAGNPTKTR